MVADSFVFVGNILVERGHFVLQNGASPAETELQLVHVEWTLVSCLTGTGHREYDAKDGYGLTEHDQAKHSNVGNGQLVVVRIDHGVHVHRYVGQHEQWEQWWEEHLRAMDVSGQAVVLHNRSGHSVSQHQHPLATMECGHHGPIQMAITLDESVHQDHDDGHHGDKIKEAE